MKFFYAYEIDRLGIDTGYEFKFVLGTNEIKKGTYGSLYWLGDQGISTNIKMGTTIDLLRDVYIHQNNELPNLNINYQKKYEEIEALLEPYKIDNMDPITTLKMLLKYNLKGPEYSTN